MRYWSDENVTSLCGSTVSGGISSWAALETNGRAAWPSEGRVNLASDAVSEQRHARASTRAHLS